MGTTESLPEHNKASSTSNRGVERAQHERKYAQKYRAKQPTRQDHAAKQTIVLCGIVIGLPQSGKKSLLGRLQGKSLVSNYDSRAAKREILVRFRALMHQPVWNRIFLNVQTALCFEHKTAYDFCVIVVHPSHDRDSVQAHIQDNVRAMIRSLKFDSADKSGYPYPAKPLCLCMLLNFRDLYDKGVSENDITAWASSILHEFSFSSNDVVIQCGTISLASCYGLTYLHHFVYQSYLKRKEYDLRIMMKQVDEAQGMLTSVPQMSYEEFEKALNSSTGQGPFSSAGTLAEAMSRESGSKEFDLRRKTDVPTASKDGKDQAFESEEGVPRRQAGQEGRHGAGRSVAALRHKNRPNVSFVNTSQEALEAFLASSVDDDDDDDHEITAYVLKGSSRNFPVDEQEDDEYFFDQDNCESASRSIGERVNDEDAGASLNLSYDKSCSTDRSDKHALNSEKEHSEEDLVSNLPVGESTSEKEVARATLSGPSASTTKNSNEHQLIAAVTLTNASLKRTTKKDSDNRYAELDQNLCLAGIRAFRTVSSTKSDADALPSSSEEDDEFVIRKSSEAK